MIRTLICLATMLHVMFQFPTARAEETPGEIKIMRITLKSGDVDVPVEIVQPAGKGPFPPVLFIHAKRGYDENERRHISELAEQGFVVVAPEWQSGRMIERWPCEHDPATELDVEAGLDI